MPTPVGHAVAGLATAWFAQAIIGKPTHLRTYAPTHPSWPNHLALACAFAAMVPDFDLLLSSHRTYSHSIGTVILFGGVAWFGFRGRAAVILAVAYGSHLLLDWLGKDSSIPPGLMALWPFSPRFYISGLDLFQEVSRRYWNLDEFILGNLRTLGRELLVLGPVAAMAWWLQRFNR